MCIRDRFNLLESLRLLHKKNIRPKLVHISTDEVYGDIKKIKFDKAFYRKDIGL